MNADDLRARFARLRVWESGGRRAPHKPLLALWPIGRGLQGFDRMAPFVEVSRAVGTLLKRFGPPRRTVRPEYPFQYLVTDSVWEVGADGPVARGRGGRMLVSSLRKTNARGGFPEEVFTALRSDRGLATEIACMLLDAHFPATRHAALLEAVGIGTAFRTEVALMGTATTGTAPPLATAHIPTSAGGFGAPVSRGRLLLAYGERCAVCAFAVRLADNPIALKGAHIKWHCAEGPDDVGNGLALCALHHSLFDAGAFTLDMERRIKLAGQLRGTGVR